MTQDKPQRYLLALAYQAGPDPRIKKGADGGRDYFTEEELEKAAWSFLQDGGRQVGIEHIDGTETRGHFNVTESYIYRGPDWDCGDGVIIKSGDWLVGGICDEIAWDLHQRGLITGMSPQGTGKRRKRLIKAAGSETPLTLIALAKKMGEYQNG